MKHVNKKAQREAALKAAREIAEKAKAEGRNLTADETTTFDEHLAKADELAAEIKAEDESRARFDRIASFGPIEDEPKAGEPAQAKSLGEHFVKTAGERLSTLKTHGGVTIGTSEFDVEGTKAATDTHATTDLPSALLTQIDRTIVHAYRRPPVVADLLGSGTLGPTSNAVTYFVEGGVEGGFATVAEKGQKPQLHNLSPTAVTDALKKIAAWWDTADEMFEDAAFMVSEINNRGMYLLSMFEEAQLLNGDGTGSNVLGLLNRSGIQTETQAATGDSAQDTIFRAMTKVQTATGLVADGIVINPADYQALRLSKDANGQYFGGGFFAGQYGNGGIVEQPPIWGLRTIVTAAIPAKTFLVGAFQAAATVYRKGGVRVEATNSDQAKFTQNIVTTRVEERLALAVRIPAATVKGTVL